MQSAVPPAAVPAGIAPAPGPAVLYMLGATAFLAGTTLLAKALARRRWGRASASPSGQLRAVSLRMDRLRRRRGIDPRCASRQPDLRTHVMRVLCGWTGVTLMFAAAAMIPLSDATAISFLNPVFCMILAIPLLGERVGPWRWLAAAIAGGRARS
jgi:drug/metabolite transporter (DMT)-like permease